MTRFNLLVAFAALVFSLAGSLPASATPQTGMSNVLVTNPPTQPVPTTAQGTTTVGGTVDVGTMPPVTLAPNGADTPWFVKDASRTPYQTVITFNLEPGGTGNGSSAAIPAGKWFVIEQVSVFLNEQTATPWAAWFNFTSNTDGSIAGITLPLTVVGTFPEPSSGGVVTTLVASAPVKTYGAPGTTLVAILVTNSPMTTANANGLCQINFSGYLTDAP
jgi:hypothetical protein